MKTMIARAVVVGALLAAGAAQAQGYETYRPRQSIYIFNYEISSTLGSFSDDYIKDTSYRGFSFEGRSMLSEMFSAGIGVTYNRFAQTYDLLSVPVGNGGTLSGPVYRYADQFALKFLAHAYPLKAQGPVLPYIGVGLGGVWTYSYGQTADFALTDNGFDFIVSPEVGLTLSLARGGTTAGLNLAFRYNYTTADFSQVKDAQTMALIIGLFGAY